MRRLVAPATLVALGIAVVALPDAGPRLFSLSEEHGPSLLDGLGLMLLLAGYGLLVREVVRRRPVVSRGALAVGSAIAAGGAAVLATAIVIGGPVWIAGVALLAAPQVALVLRAARAPARIRREAARRAPAAGGPAGTPESP